MEVSINAVLTFAGGALAFAGTVIPLLVRVWQGTEPGTRHDLLQLLWNVLLALFIPAALVATYKGRFDMASVLLCAYIPLTCLDFGLRRAPLSRGQIASFVLGVAVTLVFLGVTTLGAVAVKLTQHPSVQQNPPPTRP